MSSQLIGNIKVHVVEISWCLIFKKTDKACNVCSGGRFLAICIIFSFSICTFLN